MFLKQVQQKGEMEGTKKELHATQDACEVKYENHAFLTQKAHEDHSAFSMVVDTLASAGRMENIIPATTFDCTPPAPVAFLQRANIAKKTYSTKAVMADMSQAFKRLSRQSTSPNQYHEMISLAQQAAQSKAAPPVFERLVKRVEQMLGR